MEILFINVNIYLEIFHGNLYSFKLNFIVFTIKMTYCGNNLLHPQLLDGTKQIGTRYDCMRKGYGKGYHSPIDPLYNQPYSPIDGRKFYCGKKNILPEEYHDFGTLHICFLKGFGAGKKKKSDENKPKPKKPKKPKKSKKSKKSR